MYYGPGRGCATFVRARKNTHDSQLSMHTVPGCYNCWMHPVLSVKHCYTVLYYKIYFRYQFGVAHTAASSCEDQFHDPRNLRSHTKGAMNIHK